MAYCGTKALPRNRHFGNEVECSKSKQLRLYGQKRATTYTRDESASVRRLIQAEGAYCGGKITSTRGTGHAQADYCKQKGQLRAWGRFVYPSLNLEDENQASVSPGGGHFSIASSKSKRISTSNRDDENPRTMSSSREKNTKIQYIPKTGSTSRKQNKALPKTNPKSSSDIFDTILKNINIDENPRTMSSRLHKNTKIPSTTGSKSRTSYPDMTPFEHSCKLRVKYTHRIPPDFRDNLPVEYIAPRTGCTLNDGAWLNSSVISAQMKMMSKEESSFHIFDPLMSSVLCDPDVNTTISEKMKKTIRKWHTKNVWYLPINVNNKSHWILIVVHFGDQVIQFYDSTSTDPSREKQVTSIKLCFELAQRLGTANIVMDVRNFSFQWCKDTPQQPNGFDCGVYVIYMVRHLLNGWCWSFQKLASKTLRCRLAYEIHTNILLDPELQG